MRADVRSRLLGSESGLQSGCFLSVPWRRDEILDLFETHFVFPLATSSDDQIVRRNLISGSVMLSQPRTSGSFMKTIACLNQSAASSIFSDFFLRHATDSLFRDVHRCGVPMALHVEISKGSGASNVRSGKKSRSLLSARQSAKIGSREGAPAPKRAASRSWGL